MRRLLFLWGDKMANEKISTFLATLYGGTTEQTFEMVDGTALHPADVVDNLTTDNMIKPLSANQGKVLNETKEAIANKATSLSAASTDTQYPSAKATYDAIEALTYADVGAIAVTAKGVAGGVAELDANGFVPTSQLPSYVDDVLEYASLEAFPATGETGKIYIALDTNKTYRWGGSTYVEAGSPLALGETSSTAYRGDRGAAAYAHASDSNKTSTAAASGFYKIAVTSEGHVASVTPVLRSDITELGVTANMDGIVGVFSGTIFDADDLLSSPVALTVGQLILYRTTDETKGEDIYSVKAVSSDAAIGDPVAVSSQDIYLIDTINEIVSLITQITTGNPVNLIFARNLSAHITNGEWYENVYINIGGTLAKRAYAVGEYVGYMCVSSGSSSNGIYRIYRVMSDISSGDEFDASSAGNVVEVYLGQEIASKESVSNKVTDLSPNYGHDQYPSAKAVFDYIESAIGGTGYMNTSLLSSNWIESTIDGGTVYVNSLTLTGLTSNDSPGVAINYQPGITLAQKNDIDTAASYLIGMETSTDTLTFYACSLPITTIPVKITNLRSGIATPL